MHACFKIVLKTGMLFWVAFARIFKIGCSLPFWSKSYDVPSDCQPDKIILAVLSERRPNEIILVGPSKCQPNEIISWGVPPGGPVRKASFGQARRKGFIVRTPAR